MKYFTQELLKQANCDSDEQVENAMARWEKNSQKYNEHFKKIAPKLSANTLRIAKEFCFHDAQVISVNYNANKQFIIILQQGNQLHALSFDLIKMPELTGVSDVERKGMLWLYEEFECLKKNSVLRILFSNGIEFTIDFREVYIDSFQLQHIAPLQKNQTKKSQSSQIYSSGTEIFNLLTPATFVNSQLKKAFNASVKKVSAIQNSNKVKNKQNPIAMKAKR